MRYGFYIHKQLRQWRLVTAEGGPPPAGCVMEAWEYSRTREHDDTNPDVREQIRARGYALFKLGGEFADIAREGEHKHSESPRAGATVLATHPVHLGLGASAIPEPEFTGDADWFEAYAARHVAEGVEARLVTEFSFDQPWGMWEMHPRGSEVVLCTAGEMTLVQELEGEPTPTKLRTGEYAINPPGVWHTADVTGLATAVFITSGLGTTHRPR